MLIYDLLHEDHEEVAELLDKLENSSEKSVKIREDLFSKVKGELTAHSEAEQQTFYAALQDAKEVHETVLEDIQEHKLISQLLEELDSMDKGTEQWKAKLTVLKEVVEHHVEEEEGELFNQARQILNDEQAQEIGEQFEELKQEIMASA